VLAAGEVVSWKPRDGSNNLMVPKALRAHVLFLIEEKLSGDRRQQAHDFAKHSRRTEDQLQRFADRLEAMPDKDEGQGR
jgi:hypothetical protein